MIAALIRTQIKARGPLAELDRAIEAAFSGVNPYLEDDSIRSSFIFQNESLASGWGRMPFFPAASYRVLRNNLNQAGRFHPSAGLINLK